MVCVKGKKYVILGAVTAAAITGIVWAGNALEEAVPEVTLYTLDTQTVEKSVQCTGRLESAGSYSVYTDIACIADEILVQEGDVVQKGDVLLTVDRQATRQAMAAMGGVSPELVPEPDIAREVTAPVSGVVTAVSISTDTLNDAAEPCVVISSSEKMQVKIAIPEEYLRQVAVGQPVIVSGNALAKESYTGTLTEIAATAHQQVSGSQSGTVVDAVVTLDEGTLDDSLRFGLTAKTRVIVDSLPDALIVPYDCVNQDDDGQEYVYLYEDGRAVRRDITVSEELRSGYLLAEGLQKGDQLIAEPETVSRDGQRVAAA